MRRWEGLVDGHVRECRDRGLSEDFVLNRRRELERFGAWVRRRRPRRRLEDVGADLLVRYVKGRGAYRANQTVRGVMMHLRAMGESLVRQGIWEQNPLRWIRGPKARRKIPRRIGWEDMVRMFERAAEAGSEFHRHRAVAMLGVLYGTGVRRGELERLDVDTWNPAERTLRIDGRKTGRERAVPVPPGVAACIEAYLPRRHNVLEKTGRLGERGFFVTREGRRMSATRMTHGIQRIARQAGLGRITCHQFRHSCASDLLEEGESLPRIQKILGHTAIASTWRYVHVADPARRKAIERHPINSILPPEGAQEAVSHG